MLQKAVVLKILPDNTAELEVQRQSACGGNCSGCEGCSFRENVIRIIADNNVSACPGQTVLVETRSRQIFRYAVMVYILPVLFLVAGYVMASLLGFSESICVLIAFLLLLAGTAVVILLQKKKKNDPVTYSINAIVEDS